MRITKIDVENTITIHEYTKRNGEIEKVTDNTPYNPNNKLVSVGLRHPEMSGIAYLSVNHVTTIDQKSNFAYVQGVLNQTDLLVAHNMKYDLAWLWESGFKYDGDIWCTQVAEYISNRGLKTGLSLKALCNKYNLTAKLDNTDYDWENLDQHPWDELQEYGVGDIISLGELFDLQWKRYQDKDAGLMPTMNMSMDFLKCLIEMEKNGAHIDTDALKVLEKEYLKESESLEKELYIMASDVMGDTPIRLSSPDFRSELLYSRKVKDKKKWKILFNIGTDKNTGKKKWRPRYSKSRFNKTVRANTEVVRRTTVHHCKECDNGHIQKVKKDGTNWKNTTKCVVCNGSGYTYASTNGVAGFKLIPRGVQDASAAGFVSDSDTLELLTANASGDAKIFLKKWSRLNAVRTYLDTFVGGIWKHIGDNDILRTSLNQTITATGRLSSTAPNLHNQPRGGTFPVRKVFTSRFSGGKIIKTDYSTLEYRIAGFLAGCEVVLNAILTKEDAHAFTRDTINSHETTLSGAEEAIDRQDSKPHTFKPLYGGKSGTPREKHYYAAFMEKHEGIGKWHEQLLRTALTTKVITIPSGRQYRFPNTKRAKSGYVFGSTQIVNYPVQGFATADLVPIGIINTIGLFKCRGYKSLCYLTVHDELVVDYCPDDELSEVIATIIEGMLGLPEACKKYYGIDLKWPLGCEVNVGFNWLEGETICKAELDYEREQRMGRRISLSYEDEEMEELVRLVSSRNPEWEYSVG